MKSRLQPAMNTLQQRRMWRYFWLAAILLVGLAGAVFAQEGEDPPTRVGFVSYSQGSVVFAPQGDDEWIELPPNRPLTAGDRLWTDRGARAELQVGTSTLHLDGESHLGVSELEERALKVILQQGSLNLRVREVSQGENVEVDTPNLALRALQPGDYRVDVDPRSGQTRVSVQSGLATAFGERGEAIQMGAGQIASFAGRALARAQGPGYQQDDFALWAAERNRAEDDSVAARYVPRGVVGYAQLDQYGAWGQDPTYGTVWYPTVQVDNWAPYRYGHWDWISPWGWTWIDDAPWGFAPFHYGRWTMIADRWAWVPGRLAHRPVYAPALVVFLGGDGTQLAIGSGPAVGWYPLAPGEAWWPVFRHSPRYVGFANFNINLNAYPRNFSNHVWRHRPFAVTAVREDDFRRGRPVYRHWHPLSPQAIGHSRMNVVPVRPEMRHRDGPRPTTRLQATPPAGRQFVQPGERQFVQPGGRRFVQPAPDAPRFSGGRDDAPAVREQFRAQREQDRLQRDAERAAREQQRQAEAARGQQDFRGRREQMQRQQQEQTLRQQQAERMQGLRDQQAERIQAQRDQQAQRLQALREQQLQRLQQQREGNAPPARQFTQPVRPFVQSAPQQGIRVPQQQVRPVQQPEHVAPAHRSHEGGGRAWQRHGGDEQPGRPGQGGGRGR
ncbi:MAG TPA: DUF6600 domain-containing protein [Ramlibacter sp.]|uniref:DUF6600 domain-containing protein n=1 Tax=Ramlibacter sp. TaxID=1917967 RepID=UPI002D80DFFB|nr:DUF6600 domain-containing protein [Ramlibacter sp.]HET8747104.1 DUF6600 domain-containing protein [Ramlibacter sp.]